MTREVTAPLSTPIIEFLRCKDCGRLAASIADIRITNHKCSGAWTVVDRAAFSLESIREALKSYKRRGRAIESKEGG